MVKTNLDFTEARDSEWQWHQLSHMQVCTSLQTDNHASTPPLSFYRPDALPVTQPTASKHWKINFISVINKSVFSFIRMLTTWHYPQLPASCHCCCVPGSNRLTSTTHPADSSNPAAVGVLLRIHAGTDRWTDTVPFHRPRSTYYTDSTVSIYFTHNATTSAKVRISGRVGHVTVYVTVINN